MTIAPNELVAALVDVRRAYRLLHAYHRRLLDILATVDDALVVGGLGFDSWEPLNVDLPRRGTNKFFVNRWAWDFTPIYRVVSEWKSEPKSGTVRCVHIESIADTGYDDSSDGEPNPACFSGAEESETQLRIELWIAPTPTPNWEVARKRVEGTSGMYDGRAHAVWRSSASSTRINTSKSMLESWSTRRP